MNARSILFSAALVALSCIAGASAQTTSPPSSTRFEWGAVHMVPGQAIVLNCSLSGDGQAVNLPVELTLTDKSGNVVYRNSLMVASGQTISFLIAPDVRGVIGPDIRTVIMADIYAAIGPEFRTLTPTLKVTWPPGPTAPILDRLTPTLEMMDATTGKVMSFANNPHTLIGL